MPMKPLSECHVEDQHGWCGRCRHAWPCDLAEAFDPPGFPAATDVMFVPLTRPVTEDTSMPVNIRP